MQAIFIKASTSYPQCDLAHTTCPWGPNGPIADAYQSEQYLANILRYLKCCKLDANGNSTGVPRYPNLKQVFITTRIYGGYAQNPYPGNTAGCLNPEPFSYEEGFAVQRLIVAQIKQAAGQTNNDPYSGVVDYNNTPWFDWGPYLWASGDQPRNDGLVWCMGQGSASCPVGQRDVRDGDLSDQINFWGDFTHPSAKGAEKVADKLVNFIKPLLQGGSPFVQDWIKK